MRHGIPNLGALQAFEATARLGSFSRAAEELSLTHSAVYRQVAGLEQRLGVQLFTRVRRRVSLTDAGAEYAGRVRHHLEQLEKDTFGLVARARLGNSLHLAVLPTVASTWLIPRLPEFGRRHPGITVNLSAQTLPFQFSDHPYDAAIYHALQLWPRTAGMKLFDECKMLPVCNPSVSKIIQGDVDGLAKVPHLHMASRPDAWRRWYRDQGQEYPAAVSAGPRYELFTMTLAAVRAGVGVALIPELFVRDAVLAGQLCVPLAGDLAVREAYYFSYPADSEPSDALLAFESWLRCASSSSAEGPLPDSS